eukprot:607110-Rhodomonas_salina.1
MVLPGPTASPPRCLLGLSYPPPNASAKSNAIGSHVPAMRGHVPASSTDLGGHVPRHRWSRPCEKRTSVASSLPNAPLSLVKTPPAGQRSQGQRSNRLVRGQPECH